MPGYRAGLTAPGSRPRLPTLDSLLGEAGGRVVGPGRVELAAAMEASSVVMGLVLGQDRPQVPLAEDQHPIGDLGPGREHEPFRIGIRARAPGRDFHGLDAGASQERVEGCGELPGPVPDQEPEVHGAIAEIHQEVADLLCGPRPVRVRGHAEDMLIPEPISITKKQYRRCRVTAQSTLEVGRKHRRGLRAQEIPPRRAGAPLGRRRDLQRFEDPADRRCADRWPTLSSSPWILLYPQSLFSVASRSMSAAISALTGGRPVRFG
jgi:hypothetical protein